AFFQMTTPYPSNIIFVDEIRIEKIIDFFLQNMIDLKVHFSTIISLNAWAYKIAEKWERKTGMTHKLLMDQGVYQLNKVNETLEQSSGTWRYAEESDSSLIEKWFNLFEKDTGMPISPIENVETRVAMFLIER